MPGKKAKEAKKAATKKKKEDSNNKKKHHSKTKPQMKHSGGAGGGGGGGGGARGKQPVDNDNKQKSYEHHEHGRSVLPQFLKNIPKTKPESKDDMLGESLAAEERQHKIEHRHHHHKTEMPTPPSAPVH